MTHHCQTHHKTLSLLVSISVLGSFPQAALAEVRFGGEAAALSTYEFEEYASAAARPGTAYVTVSVSDWGVSFGEKLIGQAHTTDGDFDVITGGPTTPLTLDTSMAAEVGVHMLWVSSSSIIIGLGDVGFPWAAGIGEGSLTALFDTDQQAVAFDVLGADAGEMRLQFFGRDGALLGDWTAQQTVSSTYLFTSDASDIAAVTITNRDRSGLGYDNFRFSPGGDPGRPTACTVGGPYVLDPAGGLPSVVLSATVQQDWVGPAPEFLWLTDCPGATFDDATLEQPMLSVDASLGCQAECAVTLMVDNGFETDACFAPVSIAGDVGGGLICPDDLTVEDDGAGNLDELDAWLNGATAAGEIFNDFSGLVYTCGGSGSTVTTWWTDGGGCGGATQCSATFAIVDTTPPYLVVEPATVQAEDAGCAGEVFVELPVATFGDSSGGVVTLVTDAPALFPAGQTTVVTYTATDECGNQATATVEVTVVYVWGVEVFVDARADGGGRNSSVPLAGVTLIAYDLDNDACPGIEDVRNDGSSSHTYTGPGPGCDPSGTAVTDENGNAQIGLPPGKFLIVAEVDWDGDGVVDEYFAQNTGNISCAKWKTIHVQAW